MHIRPLFRQSRGAGFHPKPDLSLVKSTIRPYEFGTKEQIVSEARTATNKCDFFYIFIPALSLRVFKERFRTSCIGKETKNYRR